jgi:hypothetical protein
MTARLLGAVSIALAAAFFGIALYINIAEQPARLALADAAQLAEWKVSFGVGLPLQGTMTILAGIAGLATWWLRRDWRWLVGGALMLANWPWTLVVIAHINKALLATSPDAAGPQSRALIEQWGTVHAGRTAFALIATILFVWAAARSDRDSGVKSRISL